MRLDALELKIPPPLVAAILAEVMWGSKFVVAPFDVPFDIRLGAALAVLAVGLAIGGSAIVAFRRAKTTVNPLKPEGAAVLVDTGVFRYTRNPMYLALALDLVAWAIFLASVLALAIGFLFVLYIGRFQIAPEERILAAKFGDAYRDYTRRVRRWL